MPQDWRTVKVFISSTFKDMQAERDQLVRFVFPQLREELLKRRIHLVDVDLRWGVTSEQNVLEVCTQIIDECRPRILCILGGRYGWTPPGREESITAQEIRCAALHRPEVKEYRFFYFRDRQVTAAIPEAAARAGGYREFPGPEEIAEYGPDEAKRRAQQRAEKLEALKQEVQDAGYEPFIYPAHWDKAQQRLVDLKAFGNRVYADLLGSIDDEFGKEPPAELDEFAVENAAMEAFIEERVERYVIGSRQPLLQELTAFAESEGPPNILVISGEPGSGKSALLGKFYLDYVGTNEKPAHPADLVIPHFIGASPGSTDLRRTLRRFAKEMAVFKFQVDIAGHKDIERMAQLEHTRYAAERLCRGWQGYGTENIIDTSLDKFISYFPDILKLAANARRVVIVIDAINQMDATGNTNTMYWLPYNLPSNVRVLVSSREHPALDTLRRRGKERIREERVERLWADDRRAIITAFLERYRKRMTEKQIAALLGKPDSGNPLYLLTALEELRTLGTYREITQRIKEFPERVTELFQWIFQRLERDPGFRDRDGNPAGEDLVRSFASLLGVSRDGLSQMELAEILAPGNNQAYPTVPPDSQGNVVALLRLLRPHLMHRGELLDFYHGQLREASEAEYLDDEKERLKAHGHLAEYFKAKADPLGDSTWSGNCLHGLSELPYHQARGHREGQFNETLTDFLFLRAKLRTHGVNNLIADYDLGKTTPGFNLEAGKIAAMELFQGALRLSANVLASDPGQLASQFVGRLLGFDSPGVHGLLALIRKKEMGVWLRPLTPSLPPPGCYLLATLTGHSDGVTTVAITQDGRWALSGSADGTLKVWDLEANKEIQTLSGHKDVVLAVGLTRNGNQAVSASRDKTLKVWDLETGETKTLSSNKDVIWAVALTPDGNRAVSASNDKTLKVWDLETNKEIQTLRGHEDAVLAVALTEDGKRAVSASGDRTLKVWDLETGKEIQTFRGHESVVGAVALTPNGRRVVSGSVDGILKVWDTETGQELQTFRGHKGIIEAVAITQDGQRAVSASVDQTLKVWNLGRGEEIKTLSGHDNSVKAVALTPDGRRAISGSWDRTLKVWDLKHKKEPKTFRAHNENESVRAVALTPDGRRAVSASRDKTLRVWDLERMGEPLTLRGHEDDVTAVPDTGRPSGSVCLLG